MAFFATAGAAGADFGMNNRNRRKDIVLGGIFGIVAAAFVASNSFSTMLPRVPRSISTLAAVTVSATLAVAGAANDLVGFFGIVGASFGPICGAMVADYLLTGRRWSGPRRGINWAGYLAWATGFLVGIPITYPECRPFG